MKLETIDLLPSVGEGGRRASGGRLRGSAKRQASGGRHARARVSPSRPRSARMAWSTAWGSPKILLVWEAQDAEAAGREPGVARRVMVRVVQRAVGLDDEAVFEADEIEDVGPRGAWRRNFRASRRRSRSRRQRRCSLAVGSRRIWRAKARVAGRGRGTVVRRAWCFPLIRASPPFSRAGRRKEIGHLLPRGEKGKEE